MSHELDSLERSDARLAVLGVVIALAVLAAAPAGASNWSSALTAARPATKPMIKVTARILVSLDSGGNLHPVTVFFTPSVVNVGTVIIVVRNSDNDAAHQLSINGVYSRWIGPSGGTAVMTVKFKRPGSYLAGVNVDNGETGGTGLLHVLK
jgi:hypothetical protein